MESMNCLYSVYDIKAQRYGPLFEATNDFVASRQFVQLMSKVQQLFRPEYQLFFVGSFDFISGEIKQESVPKLVPVVYDYEKMEVKQ